MASKSNKEYECPTCHQLFIYSRGGYSKHIRSCRARLDANESPNETICSSKNPLLSCGEDNQVLNDPYDSYQLEDDVFSINEDSDDDNLDENVLDGDDDVKLVGVDDDIKEPNYQQHYKRRKTASVSKFQLMLIDIIYKHKASLRMYDDVCQLVNNYTSSSDFDRHARLQSRKAFL